jgi:hypothetical protein
VPVTADRYLQICPQIGGDSYACDDLRPCREALENKFAATESDRYTLRSIMVLESDQCLKGSVLKGGLNRQVELGVLSVL